MSIEAALADLTKATNNLANLTQQLLEGRAEAIEKLSGKPAKAAETETAAPRRGRPPKTKAEEKPAAKKAAGAVDAEALREFVGGWLKEATDVDERAERNSFLKSVLANFGVRVLVGPDGLNDPDDLAKAMFYFQRAKAGLSVDFGADYDFEGDPAQGGDEDGDDDLLG